MPARSYRGWPVQPETRASTPERFDRVRSSQAGGVRKLLGSFALPSVSHLFFNKKAPPKRARLFRLMPGYRRLLDKHMNFASKALIPALLDLTLRAVPHRRQQPAMGCVVIQSSIGLKNGYPPECRTADRRLELVGHCFRL